MACLTQQLLRDSMACPDMSEGNIRMGNSNGCNMASRGLPHAA